MEIKCLVCAGQVGAFPHYGGRWAEWNGNFRDTVRQFIKGTEGPFASAFASSVCGSPTIYASAEPGEGEKTDILRLESAYCDHHVLHFSIPAIGLCVWWLNATWNAVQRLSAEIGWCHVSGRGLVGEQRWAAVEGWAGAPAQHQLHHSP